MVAKFTPGPWRIANCDVQPTKDDTGARFLEVRAGEESRSPYGENVAGFIDCGGRTICMVQFEPREADARLIAAAPDLYEALKAFIDGADDGHISVEVDRAARAALAKATGK